MSLKVIAVSKRRLWRPVTVALVLLSGCFIAFYAYEEGWGLEYNPLESVRIRGDVDDQFLNRVESSLAAGKKTFIVTSAGGNSSIGVKLASLVTSHDVTVVVDRYCLSACASYFFLPANKRVVKPRSIVGYHHDAYSFSTYVLKQELDLNQSLRADRKTMEQLFEIKTDLRWRDFSLAALEKLRPQQAVPGDCEFGAGIDPQEFNPCYKILPLFGVWIPTAHDYLSFEIPVHFERPLADTQVTQTALLCGQGFTNFPMLFGDQLFYGSEVCA